MKIRDIQYIDGETKELILESGVHVILRIEDDSVGVYVDNDEVGRLDFRECDESSDFLQAEACFHLTHAFIDGANGIYKRQGIGTEAFRFFREYTSANVTFSDNDVQKKNDGSHLTGDGPGFIDSLKTKIARGEL